MYLEAWTVRPQLYLHFLLESNELINLVKVYEKSNVDNLHSKSGHHAESKTFSISKKIAAVDIFLLLLRVTWSVSLMH